MQAKGMCSTERKGNPGMMSDEAIDAILLDMLVLDWPGIMAFEDLERLWGLPEGGHRIDLRDGVNRLKGLGLVHEIEGCVFASLAARHRHPQLR